MPFVDQCTFPSNTYDPKQWSPGFIWPYVVIFIIVFVLIAEYGSQDCRENHCNEHTEELDLSDSPITMIDKIDRSISKWHNVVLWRRALLGGVIAGILILLLFAPRFPHGFQVFLISAFVFFVIYLSEAWFNDHWFKMNDDFKIRKDLQQFRDRLSKQRLNYY